MPAATSRNGTPAAVTAQRRAAAVALALEGHSYAVIAERVGYADKGTAWRAVMAVLRASVPANVNDLRALEAARLDALLASWWTRALGGDIKAADVVLRVIDKRCRLFGLEAPTRVVASVSGEVTAEIEALLDDMARMEREDALREARALRAGSGDGQQ